MLREKNKRTKQNEVSHFPPLSSTLITEQRAALGDAFIKVYTDVHLWVCAHFHVYCVWVFFGRELILSFFFLSPSSITVCM